MTRLLKLLMYGYLVASLCGFLEPFCNLAFCGLAADWIRKGKDAYQDGNYEEAKKCYIQALELEPNSFSKQEEWVRDRVRSGQSD